jgi:dynein heavy chain 1, cytosolic
VDYLLRGSLLLSRTIQSQMTGTAREVSFPDIIPGRALDEAQAKDLQGLTLLPACSALAASIRAKPTEWSTFLSSPTAETAVPDFDVAPQAGGGARAPAVVPSSSLSKERRAFLELLVVRALRKDRVMAALENYITAVLGETFPWRGLFDLEEVVKVQSSAASPILLCSEAGHDASGRVDSLAETMRVALKAVAMGSEEGFDAAEKLISSAASQGTWVLLRNIHLCPTWLEVLEKKLHNLSPDPRFRLFLTSEINPRLPSSLLRLCDVMVVEAPTGVKANVFRLFSSIPAARMAGAPAEKTRLYFLLAWFHAVVIERLRYVPLGWSKRYEFSQADAQAALDVIDDWIAKAAAGRAHVSPDAIPWEALRTLLSQSLYGGRIDNAFDQDTLDSFVLALFNPTCFDVDFPLVQGDGATKPVLMPDAVDRAAFLSWLQTLPNSNPTTWLGLAPTVEAHLLTTTGTRVLARVLLLQDVFGGGEDVPEGMATPKASDSAGGDNNRPKSLKLGAKLKALLGAVEGWGDLVKRAAAVGTGATGGDLATTRSDLTTMQRCLHRELDLGSALFTRVAADLEAAAGFLRGTVKATKNLRALVSCLATDAVPPEWSGYFVGSKALGAGEREAPGGLECDRNGGADPWGNVVMGA